jgi:hypothetical protein
MFPNDNLDRAHSVSHESFAASDISMAVAKPSPLASTDFALMCGLFQEKRLF